MQLSRSQGFTLIELVIVMVIVGIVAAMTTQIILLPVRSYIDLQRRTVLVDNAESALRRMQRDLRQALPNSVRISGGGTAIEILHVSDSGRYRFKQNGSAVTGLCSSANPALDVLDFTSADSCFELMGGLTNFNPTSTAGEFLVIYNLSMEAYSGSNRSAVVNSGNANLIKFTAFKFPLSSPQQRFFIVDTPVSYICNTSSGQLLRYAGYTITASQANPPSGVTGQLLTDKVSACQFSYTAAAATRAGLISIAVTLTDSGDTVRLMQQAHVDNAP